MCEDFINNELDEKEVRKTTDRAFNSIKNILSDNINNIRVQEALYSDYLRVAGQVDCVADWNNRLSVIDFKTFENLKEYITNYFQRVRIVVCMKKNKNFDQVVIVIAVDGEGYPDIYRKRDDWILSTQKKIKLYGEYHDRYLSLLVFVFYVSCGNMSWENIITRITT